MSPGWEVSFRLIPPETPLRGYEPPTLQVECPRCKRKAPGLKVEKLAKRFGASIPIGELARQVALVGEPPCQLAVTGQCSARAWEPPPWHWADLDRAWKGGQRQDYPDHRDPSFPTFRRLFIVTYKGTKQVFGAYADCVVVPPLFVDYPDGMSPVPMIKLLPPKKVEGPAA